MADYVNVLRLGIGGMISAADSTLIGETSYAMGINVAQKDGKICTRPGMVGILPDADDAGFRTGNIQGACFYNPSKGQSAQVFADDESSIMASIRGRRWMLKPRENATMTLQNVSGGFVGFEHGHLSYWYQAEVYAINQDGMGATWIFQPGADPILSKGYNTVSKEDSELANGATAGIYVHGRIAQVVSKRKILVGDIVHKSNLTDPSNVLKTTEQVYWATGAEFSPPSAMGNILGLSILPLQDTNHGHGSLMCWCEDGTFSLDLSRYPRSEWTNLPLTKHALLDSAARGPYAACEYNGDIIYRSRQGIASMRSAAATSRLLGNPNRPISIGVGNIFRQDREEFLQFASVSKLAREERLFATVSHHVDGDYRYAAAFMSLNFSPIDASGEPQAAWEGLWVPHPDLGDVVQFINGVFNGRERCYALTRDRYGLNHLVEVNASSEHDLLEDGTIAKIKCQLITRAIVGPADPLAAFTVASGTVFLRGIRDQVRVKISYRKEAGEPWTLSNEKVIGRDPENCLVPQGSVDYAMPMGFSHEQGKRFQFKIEWEGYLEIDAIRIKAAFGDPTDGQDSDAPDIHPSAVECGNVIEVLAEEVKDQTYLEDGNCTK